MIRELAEPGLHGKEAPEDARDRPALPDWLGLPRPEPVRARPALPDWLGLPPPEPVRTRPALPDWLRLGSAGSSPALAGLAEAPPVQAGAPATVAVQPAPVPAAPSIDAAIPWTGFDRAPLSADAAAPVPSGRPVAPPVEVAPTAPWRGPSTPVTPSRALVRWRPAGVPALLPPLSIARAASVVPIPGPVRAGWRQLLVAVAASRVVHDHLSLLTCLVYIAGLTLWTRAFGVTWAWDIHVDEITYLRLSRTVLETGRVLLYGQPFFLHPPGFFVLQGLYLQFVPSGLDPIDQVYAARYLTVVLAGVSGLAMILLVDHVGGRIAAALTMVLFALDPYLGRLNTWALLETPTNLWVVLGYLVLARSLWDDGTVAPRRAVLIGAFFGLALLTKDVAAFVTLLPLAVCAADDRLLRRRVALRIAAVALGVYAAYPLVVTLQGHGLELLQHKLWGLSRLAGVTQITGFNRAGGPSLAAALAANLATFGPTYLLLAVHPLAMPVLWRAGGALRRVVLTWLVCAQAMMAFLVSIGTLEEQFLYYLIVPAIIATGIAGVDAMRMLPSRVPTWAKAAGVLVVALVYVECTLFSWYLVRLEPDNGYERLNDYLHATVPAGARIASTTEEGQFLLDGYETGLWGTVRAVEEHRAEYVVISLKQVTSRYGAGRVELYRWLGLNGDLVWSFRSRTHWELLLYRVR